MDQAHRTKNIPGRLLHRMALGTWIVLILLTGTYIRVREGNVIPRTDWLVLAQLLAGSVGALLGIALLRRRPPIGHGVKIVLLYLFLAGFSAFWSHYPWIVFGYWLLLLGSALLTMGLVHNRDSHIRLDTVESAWLIVITFVLIKDLLIALFIPSLGAGGEMKRLGMGVTHANTISFLRASPSGYLSRSGS